MINRRDAMTVMAAATVGPMFPDAEPERLLWASMHDEHGNTMCEYSDGTVDYHFCDGKKVLGAKKCDMDYYKIWWRDHG